MRDLDVYFIRHEEAASDARKGDSFRVLTGAGRVRARRTASFLAEQKDLVDHIYTSPKLRTVQTAEIFADRLGIDAELEIRHEIASPTSVTTVSELATKCPLETHGLAIVGHEPTLSETVQLLAGDGARWTGFRTGAIAAFSYNRSDGSWRFRYQIDPTGPERLDRV